MTLLEADDLRKAVHRIVDVFAEAAEVDRVRVRWWAQFHAVQAAFWGRSHGFRIARSGSRLDKLIDFADRLAELLTEPAQAADSATPHLFPQPPTVEEAMGIQAVDR